MITRLLIFLILHQVQAQTADSSLICFCVTPGNCSLASTNTDGSGLIDIRIINGVTTLNPAIVVPTTAPPPPTTPPTNNVSPVSSGITPVITSQTFCSYGLERCCQPTFPCGIRYPPISQAKPPSPNSGQAAYGAYPWQAVLLASSDSSYAGSGVLIDHLHVLTVAHKILTFANTGQQLKVRLGEWDASSTSEPIPAQEFQVARIFAHPSYNAANLRNSIAILRLATSVQLGQTPIITTGCLPSAPINGLRCYTAGWGKNDFSNGAYQAILHEVDLPLVESNTCQNLLRATRLGANFQLDTSSFICAGGEAGKDACIGDGGAPLMCKVGSNWFVAGLVAWGIGCGQANVPGVYINVANFISWIQSTTRTP